MGVTYINPYRFGGFDPLSLSPALWLDASDTSTITASSGAVSEWRDKSGNGRHAVQATAANQPTTGTSTLNGLNTVSFDGGDFLSISNLPAAQKPFTMIAVARITSLAFRAIFGGATAEGAAQFRVNNDGKLALLNSGLANLGTSSGTVGTSRHYFVAVTYSSVGAYEFFIDAASSGTGTSNATFRTQGSVIGRQGAPAEYWLGTIAEVFKFNSVLSSDDLSAIRTYLNAKWAVY